jgi:hypothetical protein
MSRSSARGRSTSPMATGGITLIVRQVIHQERDEIPRWRDDVGGHQLLTRLVHRAHGRAQEHRKPHPIGKA